MSIDADEVMDLTKLPKIDVKPPVYDKPIRNIEEVMHESLSVHDRLANWVTRVVGSMSFIYVLVAFVFLWIVSNAVLLYTGCRPFDQPWSFAVLLLISNQVQLLTPLFILVSQNRQQRRETLRGEQEYELALRTEKETEAMFDYLRQMAERQDVMLRILELQQKRMISMKQTSVAAANRTAELMSETMVSLVKALEVRPCLIEGAADDVEARRRIVDHLLRMEEEPPGGDDEREGEIEDV